MDASLIRGLQTDNPWLQGEPARGWLESRVPGHYLPRQLALRAVDERAVLVIGPRQAGKSTLIWKTLAERGEPVLFLDCEDPSIRGWLTSPASFLADLADLLPPAEEPAALFFEEVQALPDAGLFLKGLVDRRTGRPIYATGSSAFDLEAATRESLAGRARRHLLLPLSLREIAATLDEPPALRRLTLRDQVAQLLIYGSYPRVHLAQRPETELTELLEAFVIRDASDRFRIRHLSAWRQILRLAASQIGNLCNFSEWAQVAGISNDTVAEYCHLMEQTHVLRLVRPFVGGKRAEITSAPKVFFLDNGVRNQLHGGFHPWSDRADRGALLENLVFSELAKNLNPLLDSVRYWRSKSGAEVDFVVEHQGRIWGLEVKAGEARGRLSRSSRSFITAYEPERFLIVCATSEPDQELGQTRVRFLCVEDLEAELRELTGPTSQGS